MKKLFPFLFLLLFLITSSCSSVRVINYQKLSNDVYVNNNLKEYLRNNKNPKIVLRVPNSNDKATSNTVNSKNNVLFNAIEKEFLKEGFTVRDRGLFNEIMDKSHSTDYSKFGEETNTDLILELVDINTAITYSTNKVTVKSGNKSSDEIQQYDYKKDGASIEFRLILVKNNEIAGNYKYNYNPCPDNGCPLTDWAYNKHSKKLELKESVSENYLETFITQCTQDLIHSFKS